MSSAVKNLENLLVFDGGIIDWVAKRLDLKPATE